MNQLQPAETFPISYLIGNHLDANTYYVRSVVRDALNGQVLATKNLTDNGNRYFSVLYKVPWDNTAARGRYLLITTTVYTDAAYTTKSENYGEEADLYLVQQRWEPGFGTPGIQAPKFDYEKLSAMVVALMPEKAEPAPVDVAAIVKACMTPYELRLQEIRDAIAGIKIPKPDKIDWEPVTFALKRILEEVRAIPDPVKPERVDLQPVLAAVKAIPDSIKTELNAYEQEKAKERHDILSQIQSALVNLLQNIDVPTKRDAYLKKLHARVGQ